MKLERRKITSALFFVIVVCLIVGSTSVRGDVILTVDSDITYPKTVRQGKNIQIKVSFDYSSESQTIWYRLVSLCYTINDPDIRIDDCVEYTCDSDRPESETFTISTSRYEVGDIFRFRISYKYISGGKVHDFTSEIYKIKIVFLTTWLIVLMIIGGLGISCLAFYLYVRKR